MSAVPWTTPPTLNTGQPLSYADIMLWRENALTLDSMSLTGRRAWTDQVYELTSNNFNPSPLCKASFMFRTGLTTLTIVAYGTTGLSDTINVFLNGVSATTAATTGADQTITVTLTGRGYTDRQIIEVELTVSRTGDTPAPTYAVRDMYVSPASGIVGSSPGAPTFGAISAANLTQLGAHQQWLYDRMNAVAMPLFQGQLYAFLHFWPSTKMMWRGSIARGNGANQLRCTVGYLNTNTASERLALSISTGGAYTEVATTPTITAGQVGAHTFDVDLSGYTNEQRLHVRLDQIVTTAFAGSRGAVGTMWSLRDMETTATAWTFTTPAAYSLPRESLTFSALQARLNSIASLMTTVASRISGSTDVWNRIRCFRRSPGVDSYQASFHKLHWLARGRRKTDGLYLRGKGITIGWGAITLEPELQSGATVWKPQFEEQVIGGDAYVDKYVGFDTLPGLVPGMLYYVYGEDLIYAAEVWS